MAVPRFQVRTVLKRAVEECVVAERQQRLGERQAVVEQEMSEVVGDEPHPHYREKGYYGKHRGTSQGSMERARLVSGF